MEASDNERSPSSISLHGKYNEGNIDIHTHTHTHTLSLSCNSIHEERKEWIKKRNNYKLS